MDIGPEAMLVASGPVVSMYVVTIAGPRRHMVATVTIQMRLLAQSELHILALLLTTLHL